MEADGSQVKPQNQGSAKIVSIFNLHRDVVGDYRDFVRSFFTVADDRAREFIERESDEERRLTCTGVLQGDSKPVSRCFDLNLCWRESNRLNKVRDVGSPRSPRSSM